MLLEDNLVLMMMELFILNTLNLLGETGVTHRVLTAAVVSILLAVLAMVKINEFLNYMTTHGAHRPVSSAVKHIFLSKAVTVTC